MAPNDDLSTHPPRHRFLVTIWGSPSEWWEYSASTRFGELKAVALAIQAHVDLHGRANEPYRVEVADEGESRDVSSGLGDPRED